MRKLVAVVSSVLVSLGLTVFYQPPSAAGQPAPKAKGKGEPKKKGGPADDLRKAYDLLSRLRAADSSTGRPEERIRDWTERAANYYRDGVKSFNAGDDFLAHEYGAIAHDLARAADHARNAALFDHRDSDLPPPPDGFGPNDSGERVRRDLNRAYDRITEFGERDPAPAAGFYLKAARDLYACCAARRRCTSVSTRFFRMRWACTTKTRAGSPSTTSLTSIRSTTDCWPTRSARSSR